MNLNRNNKKIILFLFAFLFTIFNITSIGKYTTTSKEYKIEKTGNEIYVSGETDASGNGSRETPYNSLAVAVNNASDGDTIYLLSDLSSDSTINISKQLILKSLDDNNYTLTWSTPLNWGFILNSNANLTISNITMDGSNNMLDLSFFQVNAGKLFINDGAVLKNNTSSWMGGALHAANGAVVTMSGGKITQNKASLGGGIGIESGSSFIMTGGEISNNTANYAAGGFVKGSSVKLSGNASVKNNETEGHGAGFVLEEEATIELSENATISENKGSRGAGVFLFGNSVFTMNGGSVTKNKSTGDGGAISLSKSTYNGNSGVISENETTTGTKNSDSYRGGAIFAEDSSKVFLNNVKIEKNKAVRGGGVYLTNNSSLTMKNGSISNNTATANAAAIFISTYYDIPSEALILGGNIENNECTGTDIDTNLISDTEFSGGAIYVGEKCTLNLNNVVITENITSQDKFLGGRENKDKGYFAGGIGLCPESSAYVNGTEGSAIYGNISNGGADVLLVTETDILPYKSPSFYTSYYALGGGAYNWKDISGNFVSGGNLDVSKKFVGLTSTLSEKDIEKANENARVYIRGNKVNAIYGAGGIMSNGILNIGTLRLEDGGLAVNKKVIGNDKDKEKEFEVVVTLSDDNINGTYGEMTFKNGVATFTVRDGDIVSATGLPENIEYTVTEKESSDYITEYKNAKGKIVIDQLMTAEITNTSVRNPNTGYINIDIRLTAIILSFGLITFVVSLKKLLS